MILIATLTLTTVFAIGFAIVWLELRESRQQLRKLTQAITAAHFHERRDGHSGPLKFRATMKRNGLS